MIHLVPFSVGLHADVAHPVENSEAQGTSETPGRPGSLTDCMEQSPDNPVSVTNLHWPVMAEKNKPLLYLDLRMVFFVP